MSLARVVSQHQQRALILQYAALEQQALAEHVAAIASLGPRNAQRQKEMAEKFHEEQLRRFVVEERRRALYGERAADGGEFLTSENAAREYLGRC